MLTKNSLLLHITNPVQNLMNTASFICHAHTTPHTTIFHRLRYAAGLVVMVMVMICALQACSDTEIITRPEQVVFPSSQVTYQRHVKNFMAVTCAFPGCHSNASRAGGVILDAYFDMLYFSPGVVTPRNPDQSRIVQVIDPRFQLYALHPISFQGRITQNHVSGIRTWIQEGAE
ncbi:MAG: hypothetical protein EAZ92_12300 [Candidatus Kapaibacterium sp.]|nr:MAG: hypothetical protein EAZ92_12300 [Candidatus Kapabacteria bacterium]